MKTARKTKSATDLLLTVLVVALPLITIIMVAIASFYADKITTMTFNAQAACLVDHSTNLPHKICAMQNRGN